MKGHLPAVLVCGVVLALAGCSSEDTVAASVPRPSPTVEGTQPDPTVWPEQISEARLVHGVVGKRGQSRLVSTFTVGDTNLEWADLCELPSLAAYAANGPQLVASVNGQPLIGTSCAPVDSTLSGTDMSFGSNPRDARQGWARLGVEPGDDVIVRVELATAKGKRITKPDVRLGFALYERIGFR